MAMAASRFKGRRWRKKYRPIVNSVRAAADRTHGAPHPATSAYSHAIATVRGRATLSGTKQRRRRNRKKAARMATCVPEITSVWNVPVLRYSSVHTFWS